MDQLSVPLADACAALGIKKTKCYGLLAEGKLRRVNGIGRKALVTTASIRAIVDAQ